MVDMVNATEPSSPPPTNPIPTAASPILESALLILLRLAYFYIARRFLSQLNPALRDLQKEKNDQLPTHTRERANSRASVASNKSGRVPSRPSSIRGTPKSPQLPLASDDESSSAPSSPGPQTIRIHHGDATPGTASPEGSGHGIEMGLLGSKLRDVRQRQVLELSHARDRPRGKRAARGLGRVARTLFALCFAESMNLVTLVLFQAVGILHARARHVNFSVSLHILLAIILLVVPLVQCLLFTYRSRESSSALSTRTSSLSFTSRLLISVLPFGLYIFLFTRIPPYITALDDWEGGGWAVPSLGRVVVLGVLIMASLSAIGAVKTAWDYLEQAAGGGRKITDADVLQAERSLYRARADVVAKRDDINRLASAQPERTGPSWMGGVFGSKNDQQMTTLKAELRGLQAMESELTRSLTGMKAKHQRQGFRKTWSGTFVNFLGYVFAIYCAARLVMCLVSIFIAPFVASTPDEGPSSANSYGDWISFLLALGISHFPINDFDIPTWSRGISLLLTGLLILSSLTMVLRWLTRVLRMTSRTVGAGFLLLTLGQLYATYIISLLVQLRSYTPPSPIESPLPDIGNGNSTVNGTIPEAAPYAAIVSTNNDDSLLQSLPDFRVFGRLFDGVFLLAALGTAVYRYVAMRAARTDDGAVFGIAK